MTERGHVESARPLLVFSPVTTRLDKQLRREITIRGETFVVIINPDGLKLVAKGRRKGLELG